MTKLSGGSGKCFSCIERFAHRDLNNYLCKISALYTAHCQKPLNYGYCSHPL